MISLNNYPPGTFVFNQNADTPAILAQTIRTEILKPEISSIVILRDTSGLKQTFETNAARLKEGENMEGYKIEGDRITGLSNQLSYSMIEMRHRIGPDFALLAQIAQLLGPNEFWVKAEDNINNTIHGDSGREVLKPTTLSLLPAGITATMSAKGGGTLIIDTHDIKLTRVNTTNPNGGKRKAWWGGVGNLSMDRAWQAPDGAIVLMKSREWGEDHRPAFHKSPDRENDGDVEERLVAVAFISGENPDLCAPS